MLHYIFLWQVLGMLIGFGCMVAIIMQYRLTPEKGLRFLFLSVLFAFMRTVLFSVSNYSLASRTAFLSARFGQSIPAGFIYILLVSLSAWFLASGILSIHGRKAPKFTAAVYWVYCLLTLSLFVIMMAGIHPSWTPFGFLFSRRIMADLPFIISKTLTAAAGASVLYSMKDREGFGKSAAFITGAVLIQAADAAVRFIPQIGSAAVPLYFLLPGLTFIVLLPRMLASKKSGGPDPEEQARRLSSRFGLEDDEIVIVEALLSGRSNKEIAFDQKLTLSTVKHRIYQIYRKCGISSRWELFAAVSADRHEQLN